MQSATHIIHVRLRTRFPLISLQEVTVYHLPRGPKRLCFQITVVNYLATAGGPEAKSLFLTCFTTKLTTVLAMSYNFYSHFLFPERHLSVISVFALKSHIPRSSLILVSTGANSTHSLTWRRLGFTFHLIIFHVFIYLRKYKPHAKGICFCYDTIYRLSKRKHGCVHLALLVKAGRKISLNGLVKIVSNFVVYQCQTLT